MCRGWATPSDTYREAGFAFRGCVSAERVCVCGVHSGVSVLSVWSLSRGVCVVCVLDGWGVFVGECMLGVSVSVCVLGV